MKIEQSEVPDHRSQPVPGLYYNDQNSIIWIVSMTDPKNGLAHGIILVPGISTLSAGDGGLHCPLDELNQYHGTITLSND